MLITAGSFVWVPLTAPRLSATCGCSSLRANPAVTGVVFVRETFPISKPMYLGLKSIFAHCLWTPESLCRSGRMVECQFPAWNLPLTNPWHEYSSYLNRDSLSHFLSVFPTTVAVSFSLWNTVQSLPCSDKPENMIFSKKCWRQLSAEGLILQDISAHKPRGRNNLGVLCSNPFGHTEIF